MTSKKIRFVRVELCDEQLEEIQPLMRLVRKAANAGKPGFLCAQIYAGGMHVFFIGHERALKFQELMGAEVGVTTGDIYPVTHQPKP